MQKTKENTLSISKSFVAQMHGSDVYKCFLTNGDLSLSVTNIGCSIVSIHTPDREGISKNIVAGFEDIKQYFVNRNYFGCVVGRYANRIADGKFVLDGQQFLLTVNNDGNHLHGGVEGFNKKVWKIDDLVESKDDVSVIFSYLSKDGEEGYQGNLEVTVTYSLNLQNQLSIVYAARTDKPTPVNLTNHSYFNLAGFANPQIYDHLLQVNASYYTEKNQRNLPTGSLLPVAGTALDFSTFKRIGLDIDKFPVDFGYDHNFVLKKEGQDANAIAAKLYEPLSGRLVNVYTSAPGMQVYTANFWDATIKGLHEAPYQKHGAVALETQSFPDSPNHASFRNSILYPDKQYLSKTMYEFKIE